MNAAFFLEYQKMNLDLVHQMKGKLVCYVLELEPENGRAFRYVGTTHNIERRMAEHTGMRKGGAAWTAKHKVKDILSCRVCQTEEEAAAMEVMLTQLHQSHTGYQQTRGELWSMPGHNKHKPPYFDNAHDHDISDTESPRELVLPTLLPESYHVLVEENGTTDEHIKVSAPCVENWKDPDGRRMHLAVIVCR